MTGVFVVNDATVALATSYADLVGNINEDKWSNCQIK